MGGTIKNITIWEAIFDCDYSVVIEALRDFFERCRNGSILVSSFGFFTHPNSWQSIECEEIALESGLILRISLDEFRHGNDTRRSQILGVVVVSPRSRQTHIYLKCPIARIAPSTILDDTMNIAWRIEREATGAGVHVKRMSLPYDAIREFMLSAPIPEILRVISTFNVENADLGYWIEIPEEIENCKDIRCFILKTRGMLAHSVTSFTSGIGRWEVGFVECVQAGEKTRLTVRFPELSERPLFWQYMTNLCLTFDRFGFLASPVSLEFERHVDSIESFAKVREVPSSAVNDLVPLNLLEQTIQEALEEIIGEPFTQKDWGGEDNDLFTSRLVIDGRRATAAFLLKGRGTSGALTIAKCGANGDQIARLLRAKVDLYIVQHVGKVDQAVRNDLREKVELENWHGHRCQMCIIDGSDLARILKAYGKI